MRAMKIWLVEDGDYEQAAVVAAYDNEAAANLHAEMIGASVLPPVEVQPSVASDVPDNRVELARETHRQRQWYEEQARHSEQREVSIATMTLEGRDRGILCTCRTFTEPRLTANGYCRYCGGFAPDVFRKYLGDAALIAEIDKLDIHGRTKMRRLCGLVERGRE
jgi:hypothetical protein